MWFPTPMFKPPEEFDRFLIQEIFRHRFWLVRGALLRLCGGVFRGRFFSAVFGFGEGTSLWLKKGFWGLFKSFLGEAIFLETFITDLWVPFFLMASCSLCLFFGAVLVSAGCVWRGSWLYTVVHFFLCFCFSHFSLFWKWAVACPGSVRSGYPMLFFILLIGPAGGLAHRGYENCFSPLVLWGSVL